MSKRHDGGAMREQVYDYRRGDLSELDEARFEEALEGDADGAQHARRVLEMLELASGDDDGLWTPEPLTGARADDLFARIEAELDAAPGEPVSEEASQGLDAAPVVRLDERFSAQVMSTREEPEEETGDRVGGRGRGWWVVFGVAAAALLALGFMLGRAEEQAAPGAPVADAVVAPGSVDQESVEDGALEEAAPALATLEPQRTSSDAVRVFANGEASWTLSGEGDYELVLESGTVLVEFLPMDGEKLTVISGATRVSVVGTVFYVKAPKGASSGRAEVGVLTGKVRVGEGEDVPVELTDGEALGRDGSVEALKPSALEGANELVDLERHRAQLASRAEPAPTPGPARVERAPARKKVSETARLREQARAALEARDYARQARVTERLLKKLGPDSRESATLRLELSRLYIRHLDDRARAIGHLRVFLRAHGDDVAAGHARRQLCRLLGAESIREPECRVL
jgi:hypothetical protein